jgi:hypothetical protein
MQMINETEPKRGRGRPRINPDEPVRYGKYCVYLEPSRLEEMKNMAVAVGLNPSDFARTAICQYMMKLKQAA